jgi:hypothetical protein
MITLMVLGAAKTGAGEQRPLSPDSSYSFLEATWMRASPLKKKRKQQLGKRGNNNWENEESNGGLEEDDTILPLNDSVDNSCRNWKIV